MRFIVKVNSMPYKGFQDLRMAKKCAMKHGGTVHVLRRTELPKAGMVEYEEKYAKKEVRREMYNNGYHMAW